MKENFKRNCPDCGEELIYTTKGNRDFAERNGKKCKNCARDLKPRVDEEYYKSPIGKCPKCGDEVKYWDIFEKIKAIRKGSVCKKCRHEKFGFKKDHKLNDIHNNSEYNLNKLLEENYISFYWLGFIIADCSLNNNKFELCLAEKDLNHLQTFADFIGYNKEPKYREKVKAYRISFKNRTELPKIQEKYNLKERKTYNPIDFKFFEHYSDDLLLCLLIGIIDGDGHIRKTNVNSGSISITSHYVWESFYKQLTNRINGKFKINKCKNRNTIRIDLFINTEIKKILNKMNYFNLPILQRKWDKLNHLIE